MVVVHIAVGGERCSQVATTNSLEPIQGSLHVKQPLQGICLLTSFML